MGYFIIIWMLTVIAPAVTLAQETDTAAEIRELKQRLEGLERKVAADEKERKKKTKELEEKASTLASEVQKSRLSRLLPEKQELKSEWGLGPAASSVYHVKKGISFASYGEANYRNLVSNANGDKDKADMLRFVTYLGYKFTDRILMNSEIEYEHGTTSSIGGDSGTSSGSVSVEFAYLDFLFKNPINARAGLALVPMGFLNEIHEPPYFYGVTRPEVETRIIPSTWRELGGGIFGKLGSDFEYRTYVMNGLRADRFSSTSPLRGGRQKGNRALFESVAWTGRMDYTPSQVPGLLLGGSVWLGNSGQDETIGGAEPSVFTTLGELHAQYRYRGLELRALGSWGTIGDAATLSAGLGETIPDFFYGWYMEAGYNFLPKFLPETKQYLAPFFRFEMFDTQASIPSSFTADPAGYSNVYTMGLSYKPIPLVVLKFDYRNFSSSHYSDEVALGIGYAF